MALKFRQKTVIDSGPYNGSIITKDFTLNDTTEISDCDEALYSRLKLGTGQYLEVQFNSISVAEGVTIKLNQDALIYFINDEGITSAPFKLKANRLSIMHIKIIGMYIENLSNNPLEGIYYIIGN